MAMYTYTLQTVQYLSGSVLYEGICTTNGLTPPSYASLKPTSRISEIVDAVSGEYRIPDCEFSFEDETGHFWRDFLSSETAEIKMTITEPVGTSVLFWGVVQPLTDDFSEYDLYVTQRRGVFTCKGKVVDLKSVDLQTVFDASATDMINLTTWTLNNSPTPVATVAKIMNIKRFLARIFQQVNTTLDDTDIDVSALQDVQYGDDNRTNWIDWANLYFWCGTQNPATLTAGWFQAEEWLSKYASCFDLIGAICKSLLCIPVWHYDGSASRYKVRIRTRGHSASGETAVVMGPVLDSHLNVTFNRKAKWYGAHSGWSGAAANPNSPTYCNANTLAELLVLPPFTFPFTSEIPASGTDFDVECFFLGDESLPTHPELGDGYSAIEQFFHYTSGTTAIAMQSMQYWDYVDKAWSIGQSGWNVQWGVTEYFARRFNWPRRRYTRTYSGIGPSGAKQDTLILLAGTDIVDEDSVTRHFYATEIYRDIEKNEIEVVWEEI